jgi:hypothetical protein
MGGNVPKSANLSLQEAFVPLGGCPILIAIKPNPPQGEDRKRRVFREDGQSAEKKYSGSSAFYVMVITTVLFDRYRERA